MIGKTISRYKILGKLGQGGMGEVYLAEDTELGRKAALKFLPLPLTADPALQARFKREARAAAALNHPNIITIYEVGEEQDRAYIAMEYVDGESLKDLLAREELQIPAILDFSIQICEGLSEAHHAGIVHRDLKPANILLDKRNRVKIADFGLAKLVGATQLTGEGAVMGTPAYMSPEQVRGEPLDTRSDIFSLGIVLYELVTRRLPFPGDNQMAVFAAIKDNEAEPLLRYKRGVSPGLQRIVDKALDKELETRYQHVEDLLAELKREKKFLSGVAASTPSLEKKSKLKPREIPPPKLVPKPTGPKRLSPFIWVGIGAVVVILVVYLLSLQNGDGNKPADFVSLSITTTPANATVLLDSNAIGTTPISNYRANAGKVALRIEKTNYLTIDTTVVLVKGRAVNLTLALKPALARVTIQVTPADAAAVLDGESLATAQLRNRSLSLGAHSLNLSREGYNPKQIQFRVTTPRDTTLHYELDRVVVAESGVIRVQAFLDGRVYIDNNLMGTIASGETREYDQPVGQHRVEVRSANENLSQPVTVAKGKTAIVTLRPTPPAPLVETKSGTIRVEAYWGGSVYIDGNLMGNIANDETREYDQPVGQHRVEVRSANESLSQIVTVAEGQTVIVTLRPTPPAPPAETKPTPKYTLRRVSGDNLSPAAVKNMLKQYDFYCQEYGSTKEWNNPEGRGLANDFVLQSGGKIVLDRATDLSWQQSGSGKPMIYKSAQAYIAQLNRDNFGGYSDWRLPTLEEAMSLMEPGTLNGDLYIDSRFDKTQRYIWTVDKVSAGRAWVVDFFYGGCGPNDIGGGDYVRAVRS